MKMVEILPPRFKIFKTSLPLVFNYFLFSLMIALFTYTLVRLGESASPGWEGNYLIWVSLVVALEALFSRKILSNKVPFTLEWILGYLTEAVMILISMKVSLLIIHLIRGQAVSPQFLDNELFFSVLYAGFVWVAAYGFGQILDQLEENPEIIEHQKAGYIASDMEATRRKLIGFIFGFGTLMLVIYTLLHLQVSSLVGLHLILQFSAWPIIAYFVIGLIIISQTRYASLRMRWYMDNVIVGRHFGPSWLIYSLVLLLCIGVIATFLPTSYSYGFLTTLQTLFTYLFALAMALFIGITTPLGLAVGWIQSLLSSGNVEPPTATPPTPVRQTPLPLQALSVPDWIQSFLFWIILIGITVFSIIYYFRSHKQYLGVLGSSRLGNLTTRFWQWLRLVLKRVNKQIAKSVNEGLQRLTIRGAKTSRIFTKGFSLSEKIPNRQLVRQVYLQMVELASSLGIQRRASNSPSEYAIRLSSDIPERNSEIIAITKLFSEARYTTHDVNQKQVQITKELFEVIQSSLTKQQNSDAG